MKDKGNDGKGNIPERDLWETEQSFWDKLNNKDRERDNHCKEKETVR
jgi:hypothetical protein